MTEFSARHAHVSQEERLQGGGCRKITPLLFRWKEREVQGREVLIRVRLEKVEFLQEEGSGGWELFEELENGR